MANMHRQLIVGVIDTSGSMAPFAEATRSGWNGMLAEQGSIEGYQTFASLYTFNQWITTHYEMREWAEAPEFEMRPKGRTALLDAVKFSIERTSLILSGIPLCEEPGNVAFNIFTDGMENASDPETTYEEVAADVTRKTLMGWKFSFAAANMDAIKVASTLGIGSDTSITYTTENTQETFSAFSQMNTRGLTTGTYSYTGAERRKVT